MSNEVRRTPTEENKDQTAVETARFSIGTSNNILKKAQLREVKEQQEPNEVETNHQDEDLN